MLKKLFCCLVLLQGMLFTGFSQQINWGATGDIAASGFDNLHPRIIMDRSGDPLVIWGRLSDHVIFISRWNGSAFTMPVALNPPWMTIATADWMGPDIAAYGDTVYVVVKRMPEVADTNRIFIFSSFNAGATFNAPVELASIADSISRFPTVTTDASGNPIVGFMKFDPFMTDIRWAVTRSNDFGATFSTDVKASGWGGSQSVCDCCPGSVVSQGDTTLMLYRNNDNNIRDMWAGLSYDNATSFNSGMAVDNNNWMIMMCPSSGPDGIVVNDTLYSVFMNGGSGSNRTYLSKTDLSSGTLSSVSLLTNPPGLTLQNFPRIAGDDSAVAVVWRQVVNGIAQLPIRFTDNITTGLPVACDTVDVNNITNTDVAIRNGKIAVVWQDDNSGTVKYRMGTYIPSGTSVPEHTAGIIEIFPNPSGDYLNISSVSNKSSIDFQVINSIGEIVCQENNFTSTLIDISHLQSGQYFINIFSREQTYVAKFIRD